MALSPADLQGLSGLSPVQLELESCLDLKQFEQQHFHLVGGLLVALFLGAQVVVPEKGTFHPFDLAITEGRVRQLFTTFWCSQAPSGSQSLWCGDTLETLRWEPKASAQVTVQTWALTVDQWNAEELMRVGEVVWTKRKPAQISRLTLGCDLGSQLKISEGSQMFTWFWRIHSAVSLRRDITSMSSFLEQKFIESHPAAQVKAQKLGFQFDESSCEYGCYNVFQLCAEDEDFMEQCLTETEDDPGAKCAENLLNLGNMLLSEGVNPSIPIYLITGLSESELQKWKTQHHSTALLFQVYTVVTPQQLKLDVARTPNRFAAVNFALNQEAELLIASSSCSLAAFSADARHYKSRSSLFFDRQPATSPQFQWHQPPGIIFPVRRRIKWVFTLPSNSNSAPFNLSIAAVKSAMSTAPSLVPLCMTAATPGSDVAKHMVSLGVRVVHHQPTWTNVMEKLLSKYLNIGYVPFNLNADQLVSRLLRIDLPIVGILDQFVLYTDPDVLFTGDVTWQGLLGPNYLRLERLLRKKKLLKAPFDVYYAPRNAEGLPKFFGLGKAETSQDEDTAVMFLNLKTLGESYFDFRRYVFDRSDMLWQMLVSLDPAGYSNFYVNADGKTWSSRISPRYNSVQALRGENQSNITRFAGSNCDRDILPYVRNREERSERDAVPHGSKALLKQCGHVCAELCRLYQNYLESGYPESGS